MQIPWNILNTNKVDFAHDLSKVSEAEVSGSFPTAHSQADPHTIRAPFWSFGHKDLIVLQLVHNYLSITLLHSFLVTCRAATQRWLHCIEDIYAHIHISAVQRFTVCRSLEPILMPHPVLLPSEAMFYICGAWGNTIRWQKDTEVQLAGNSARKLETADLNWNVWWTHYWHWAFAIETQTCFQWKHACLGASTSRVCSSTPGAGRGRDRKGGAIRKETLSPR